MCGPFVTTEHHHTIHLAKAAAEEILERYYRAPIFKDYDLSNPKGFDRAVGTLSGLLRAATDKTDADAVRASMKVLDIHWGSTTAAQRKSLISEALQAAGRHTALVPVKVGVVFEKEAPNVAKATKDFVRRSQKLSISGDFSTLDKRIIKHLQTSEANYVSNAYGVRQKAFGKKTRQIVADGLEQGLGRDDIARDLEKAAQRMIASRGTSYWDVVASSFMGRGRSYTQLSAYSEAHISYYVIEAVLDEVTTEICRFLDGKRFSVDHGLRMFEQVEAEPERIKELNPWVRSGLDKNGDKILYVKNGQREVPIATVVESGVGRQDERGIFRNAMSVNQLTAANVGFPPFHGHCRTSTLAIL